MKVDATKAVEIAPRIWWVGNYLEEDLFQCHVYLIEQGDQSVLIDPGSQLTFRYTLAKVESIIPFSQIKYFICHHQDPDITGALNLIDQMISREDAVILSHWRGNTLLKHYGLNTPLHCIEKMDWNLKLQDRTLRFIFTPYLHFPGAFMTLDSSTGVLFSSDVFGGFTKEWTLYAQDESYLEAMRPFHEHYMPSREILQHSMLKLEELDLTLIAPQHGSLIPQNLISYCISQLKNLDCGLFLMTQTSTEVSRLSQLNKILKVFLKEMVVTRQFSEVVEHLVQNLNQIIAVDTIEFFVQMDQDKMLHMEPSTIRTGKVQPIAAFLKPLLGLDRFKWNQNEPKGYRILELKKSQGKSGKMIQVPLFSSETKRLFGLMSFKLLDNSEPDTETGEMLREMQGPFGIALEREILLRSLEWEKQQFYEKSIRDSLTTLYTRNYMNEMVGRFCLLHDREPSNGFGLMIFDLDNFKQINDTYGHVEGDQVLRVTGELFLKEIRGGDVAVRYGGEEFALFILHPDVKAVEALCSRLLALLSDIRFEGELKGRTVTASAGIAMHQEGESLEELIVRADKALYSSKRNGKNRLTIAE